MFNLTIDYHNGALQGDTNDLFTEVVAPYEESQLTSRRVSWIVISMNTEKLMRLQVASVSLLFCVFSCWVACKKKDAPLPAPPAEAELWSQIPSEISTWVFVHKLGSFLHTFDSVLDEFPRIATVSELRARWKLATGFGLLSSSSWAQRGIDTDKPAVLFRYQGHWCLHMQSIDEAKVRVWLDSLNQSHERLDWRHGLYTLYGVEGAGGPPALYALLGSTGLFVLVPTKLSGVPSGESFSQREASRFLQAWSESKPTGKWGGRREAIWLRTLFESTGVCGVVDPSDWIASLPARSEQAKVLRERIESQSGTIAFGLVQRGGMIDLEIRSVEESAEPVFVTDLGQADSELPMLGGLIEPGVLGVFRLSGSPWRFYQLLRSSLDAHQRRELDRWGERIKSEFQLDLRTDIVDNLSGHLVVVIYGFSASFFREFSLDSVPGLVSLSGTREAVLWTVKDGKSLSGAIDIWTGLSKGKLRRQRIDDRVQYAWFEEGTMEWALLVDEDSMIFADGLAAFDHATLYQRSARPVSSTLHETLKPLLMERDRSGFYLDLRSLSALLAETENTVAAAWLRPFSSVLLTTGPSERGITSTHIRFSLSSDAPSISSKPDPPATERDGTSGTTKIIAK